MNWKKTLHANRRPIDLRLGADRLPKGFPDIRRAETIGDLLNKWLNGIGLAILINHRYPVICI